MMLYSTNFKEDLEEDYLETSQEEIGQTDIEDICFENILDNIVSKYDCEYMEDYIRDHIDNFELSENENDSVIEKLAIHLVEEEIPEIRNEVFEEAESLIDEFIEQYEENRLNSLFAY